MSTAHQIAANQANAQRSTGPRTEAGKAISSRNAVVTGLTGRTVLLASDDVDEYAIHLSKHMAQFLPINDLEAELVQSIADCEWRLRRILTIEAGIFALGEQEFADSHPSDHRALRNALIKTQTHLKYERQLKNLSIQESRLLRQKSKCIAAFHELKEQRPKPAATASPATLAAPTSSASSGFEFATAPLPSATSAAAPLQEPSACPIALPFLENCV